MQKQCAWCGQRLPSDDLGGDISHGICQSCTEEFFNDDQSLRGYLNRLSVPVLAVDSTGRLITASDAACAMLGREPASLAGLTGGEAFSCRWSRLPSGCGETLHCRTCAVRRTVMGTFATGQPRTRVPARADLTAPDGDHAIEFRISTQKVGATVLLRIDAARPCEPGAGADQRAREAVPVPAT